MPIPRLLALALPAFALCAGLVSPARAIERIDVALRQESLSDADRIREGRTTLAPFAFIRFCVSNPGDCSQSADGSLAWTPESERLVRKVNGRVNRSIVARNERGDEWRADVRQGDCEDFALTKRRELLRQAVPASALSMAIARTSEGEGHAVLVLRTSAGDFILDNRTDRLLKWNETDLRWRKISSAEDPRIWRLIN